MLRRRHSARRGSSSLDAAIVIPALLLFLLVIIGGARIAMAQQSVTVAAQAAARAASLERSAPEAVRAGQLAAERSGGTLACQPQVSVTGNWDLPLGTPGTATATVTCRVKLSDLAIPGMPGEIVITRTAESPIDRYRSRTSR